MYKLVVILFFLSFLFSCKEEKKREEVALPDGKFLYEQHCVVCHGDDGALGLSGAKDLRYSTLDPVLTKSVIENGRAVMPRFKGQLNTQELDEVVKYIITFRSKKP